MVGYFHRAALLDGNGVAGGRGHVDGGPGRGAVEGNAVLFGEDGDVVGADLVGEVAVGRDAVRADHDSLDFAGAHQAGGHVVADDGGGDMVGHQLPRGEARALQKGAGLVGVDMDFFAHGYRGADDAERGAVAAGGQGAGVAVRQNANTPRGPGPVRGGPWISVREQGSAKVAHGLAGGDVFFVHGVGFGQDFLLEFVHGRAGGKLGREEFLHAVDGPEEIDRGGASAGQAGADFLELGREVGRGCGPGLLRAKGHAVGGGDANSRRAAHNHGDDDVGHLVDVGGEHVALFKGKLGLIDEADAIGGPAECGNHTEFSVNVRRVWECRGPNENIFKFRWTKTTVPA